MNKITDEIYVASYGYENCDAIATVFATTFESCLSMVKLCMEDEREVSSLHCHDETHTSDDEDCDYCNPIIWYVGPLQESVEFLRESCMTEQEFDNAIEDIQSFPVVISA